MRERNWGLMEKKGITETRTKKILEAERGVQTAMEISAKCDKERSGIHPVKLPLYSQSIPVLTSKTAEDRANSLHNVKGSPNQGSK